MLRVFYHHINLSCFILCGGLLLLVSACQVQTLPDSKIDDVKYRISGELEGDSWKMQAGEEETYAFAQSEVGAANVYEFIGRIAPAACEDCGEWLEIRVRDLQLFEGADTANLEQIFYTGRRSFLQLDGQRVKKKAEVTLNPTTPNEDWTYEWSFDDQTSSQEVIVQKIFRLEEQME
ncbi:MAG: hypothetical protein AAFR59_09905, partial [Bacteroidota bacterium]